MIVCFGETLVDLFAEPVDTPLDRAERFVPHLGGAPANVALALGRLGVPTRFVGAVGRDAHGQRLVRGLDEAGVDTTTVHRVAGRTGITFVRVEPTGQRSFLFYREAGADAALTAEMLRDGPQHPLEGARALVLGSSALCVAPLDAAARWLLAEAEARAVPLVVDLNVRAHLWRDPAALRAAVAALVRRAAVLKASDDDLTALGWAPTVEALRAEGAPGVVALTRGADGATLDTGALRVERPAVPTTVRDATGAGDAFLAGLLAARAWWPGDTRDDWTAALEAASALGARACEAVGAVTAVRAPWPEALARLAARATGP